MLVLGHNYCSLDVGIELEGKCILALTLHRRERCPRQLILFT